MPQNRSIVSKMRQKDLRNVFFFFFKLILLLNKMENRISNKCDKEKELKEFAKYNFSYKWCVSCREKRESFEKKKFCEHGKYNKCRECWKEGKTTGLCNHGREKNKCKECPGAGVCEHDKLRTICVDCGGGRLCKHENRKDCCKICRDKLNEMAEIGGERICSSCNKQKVLKTLKKEKNYSKHVHYESKE